MMKRPIAALLPIFIGLACGPREEIDFSSPRILNVNPSGAVVALDVSFTLRFSEALNANTVNNATVVIVDREELSEAFLNDLESAGLTESRLGDVIPVDVTLEEEDTLIRVVPREPLPAAALLTLALSAEVRDANGNPLTGTDGEKANFLFNFQTDDGPPVVVVTDVPDGEGDLVPTNRKRFTVVFDEPIASANASTLRVEGPGAPGIEQIEVSEDRRRATLILAEPAAGCARFSPNTGYALVVGPGIKDDDDNDSFEERFAFTTAGACDTTPVRVVGLPLGTAGEIDATVVFETDDASTTEVRFGLFGAALDCLGQPCPIVGEPALLPDSGGRFTHAVAIGGLEVNNLYTFEVRAVDVFGFVALARGEFLTAPLPDVAVNEVLADAADGVGDEAGEFVEVINYGQEPIDISAWALRFGDGNPCTIPDGVVLEAGGVVVFGRDAFDEAVYGTPSELVVRMGSTICGALVNGDRQTVGLIDDDGRPISTYSGHLLPRNGRSIERTDPGAPDVAASFCYSRLDTGPSPGAVNGVVTAGCDEE